jgi:hypothetical protein
MNKGQIIVTIDNDGNVTMEGVGFKGTACDKAMAEIEKSLGIQTKRVNKPEYSAFASAAQTLTLKAGGGK